jgi:3-methyladenine DNA glycosylase AlkD
LNFFLDNLKSEFERQKNTEIATKQKAYIRDQFEYYGLKTEVRRQIQKPFLVMEVLPEKNELEKMVNTFWRKPQRAYHYLAQELAYK